MYTTIITLAALASYALAAPGQAESETTVTVYKTITSCSGAAPVCTPSATQEATAYSTRVSTLTSCAPNVSSCPARSKAVHTSIAPIVSQAASVIHTSIAPIVSQAASVTASASTPASSTESTSYVTNLNTVTSCPGGTATACPTSGVPVPSAPVASATFSVVASGVPGANGNGTIVSHGTTTPSLTVFSGNAGSLLSFSSLLVGVVGILGAIHTL